MRIVPARGRRILNFTAL